MENFNTIIFGNNIQLYNFAESNDINISNAFTTTFMEIFGDSFLKTQHFLYEHPNVFISPTDVVVDCGANMGLFSAWAATLAKTVYSFEPSNGILPYLEKTSSLYNNILIVPHGVGEKEEVLSFTECYFSCGSHFSKYKINEFCLDKTVYDIKIISLDQYFINKKINYIKIDVEGAELEVIKGAKNIIKAQHPKMVIACYHIPNELTLVKESILSINSSYCFDEREGLLFAWT